jgi:hypothetical protein
MTGTPRTKPFVRQHRHESGFHDLTWMQTLSSEVSKGGDIEPTTTGTGRGAFLVVRAQTPAEMGPKQDS